MLKMLLLDKHLGRKRKESSRTGEGGELFVHDTDPCICDLGALTYICVHAHTCK